MKCWKSSSCIIASAKTGQVDDSKIFISSIDEVIRIRTEETGESAMSKTINGWLI